MLEMVASTVIVFIITFIVILIAIVLICYLFLRRQKKFTEQLQAIGEAIPEGKRFVKPQVKQTQSEQNPIEQRTIYERIPANASLPYYSIVRPSSPTHAHNVHLETNPAYF